MTRIEPAQDPREVMAKVERGTYSRDFNLRLLQAEITVQIAAAGAVASHTVAELAECLVGALRDEGVDTLRRIVAALADDVPELRAIEAKHAEWTAEAVAVRDDLHRQALARERGNRALN